MEENTQTSSIVWWVCFLSSEDSIYATISEIGEKLSEQGQQLVVFGREGDYSAYKGFTHIAIPFSLVDQGQKWSHFVQSGPMPMAATALPELMQAEKDWCRKPLNYETEFFLLRALAFWTKAVQIMSPCVILTWGTTAPFSRMLMRVAQITQIPSFVVERGLTEQTLMIGVVGQCLLSNIGMRPNFVNPMREKDSVEDKWREIISYFETTDERNYPNKNIKPDEQSKNAVNGIAAPGEKVRPKTVLFLGAHDLGSGLPFDHSGFREKPGNWGASSRECLVGLAYALAKVAPNAELHVKAHPHYAIDLTALSGIDGLDIISHDSEDFHELIRMTDVLVTPISTTQIYGFFYDKPIVTMANSFFSGRNITYEAYNQSELEVMVAAALSREQWPEKREIAKHLITALFREEFIGLNDEVPTTLKLRDLAEHLSHFRTLSSYGLPRSDVRMKLFEDFCDLASGSKRIVSAYEASNLLGVENWNRLLVELKSSAAADFKSEIDNQKREVAKLQEKLRTQTTEHEAAIDKSRSASERAIEELKRTVDEYREQVVNLTSDLERTREHADRLYYNFQASTQENASLKSEVKALREQADRKSLAFEKLSAAAQGERQLLETRFRTEISIERAAVADWKREIDIERERVKLLRTELNGSTSINQDILKKLDTVRTWAQNHIRWRKELGRASSFKIFSSSLANQQPDGFDPIDYLLARPDLVRLGIDPIYHWNKYGRFESANEANSKLHQKG